MIESKLSVCRSDEFRFVNVEKCEVIAKRIIMDKRKYLIIRLFFVLFTMSVSVAVLPSGIINVHGLFGEVTTAAVVEDKDQEIADIKFRYNRSFILFLFE